MKLLAAASVVLGAVLLFGARSSLAITYGTPDGNGHPNVGALVAEFEPGQKDILCSGTLISPTVFVTASHCTAYLESVGITDVWVTFDPVFDADSGTFHHGTYHTHPGFGHDSADPKDVAVVVLDALVAGITPASLPAAGQFDTMAAKNGLRGQKFTAVGYGVQDPVIGGGPPSFPFDGVRRVSASQFQSINESWLRLSQNAATGNGGTCYGDSGGPNFLGSSTLVAAVTVTGDSQCLATNVTYRLDTASARDFLDDYVTLP